MNLYGERDHLHLDKALDIPVKMGSISLAEKVSEAMRARPALNSDCVAGLTNPGVCFVLPFGGGGVSYACRSPSGGVVDVDSVLLQQKANNSIHEWREMVCVILAADCSLGERNGILMLQFNN